MQPQTPRRSSKSTAFCILLQLCRVLPAGACAARHNAITCPIARDFWAGCPSAMSGIPFMQSSPKPASSVASVPYLPWYACMLARQPIALATGQAMSKPLGSLELPTCQCRVVTSKEYPVDSKVFFWSLGANPWGRYLRISENGAGLAFEGPDLGTCLYQCMSRGFTGHTLYIWCSMSAAGRCSWDCWHQHAEKPSVQAKGAMPYHGAGGRGKCGGLAGVQGCPCQD